MNKLDLDQKGINNSLKFILLENSSEFKMKYYKDMLKLKKKSEKIN